jgi:hypothetical protein
MTLPPIVYTPPAAKPKPAQRRSGIGRLFKAGSASEADDVDEAGEAEAAAGIRQQVTQIAGRGDRGNRSSDGESPPQGKPQSAPALFSDGMMKAMLQVQEDAQATDGFQSFVSGDW